MKIIFTAVSMLAISVALAATPNAALLEMDLEELMEKPYVNIASGTLMPIEKAAAVATVITAADIRAMGATDLDQVLETVPGLHVGNTFSNYNPIYSFRGLFSTVNPDTLILVNGIPITSLYRGDRGGIWGGMPVRAIERIEIIRGPGSAIYGADAFGGVINILTKTANDIVEDEVGAGYGSFNTKDAWLLTSARLGSASLAFTAEVSDTDGPRETIDSDYQTQLDAFYGTNASQAPGATQLSRRAVDLRLDLEWDLWRLRAGYQGRDNVGNGAGFFEALDPTGRYESTRYSTDLQYLNPTLSENWGLTATLSMHHVDQQNERNTMLLPPGTYFQIPIDGQLVDVDAPNGLVGNPEVWENNYRLDIASFYSGFEQHRVRIGSGIYYGDIYRVRETKNFDVYSTPVVGEVRQFWGTDQVFMQPNHRKNYYLSLQDEWWFHPDWSLTSGIRYDHYSDFGETVNPRMALVWAATDKITAKVLYGRAFRAPSFYELYSDNPVSAGNPDLDPQVINTVELAISVRPTTRFQYDLNIYKYEARNLIGLQPSDDGSVAYINRNAGLQKAYGGEFEARYQVSPDLLLSGNYAYVNVHDAKNREVTGSGPAHQAYLRAEWRFLAEWLLVPQVHYVGERERTGDDTRDALDGYTLVNVALHRRNLINKLDVTVALHNLFDEDVREPASIRIENDLPKAGFSAYGSVSYRF